MSDYEALRRWREADLQRARDVAASYRASKRGLHRAWNAQAMTRQRARNREMVLDHYGRECSCCGSAERLTIDHMSDGSQHRAELGDGSSGTLHRWLIRNGFPAGYQVLCRSCNASKGSGEHCRRHQCRTDHA
jgi:hypothetical protein